jgi:hypothetical protein
MATVLRNVPVEARSRPVVRTGRLLNCQLAGDDKGNTTEAVRLQRLRLLGIIGQRARLLAGIAWEDAHG